jgi:hypothetical protein
VCCRDNWRALPPVLKILYLILYSASAAALVLLFVEVGLQRGLPENHLVRTNAMHIFNVALASTLLLVTALPTGYLLYRIAKVRRAGLVYSKRRRVTTQHRVAVAILTLLLQVSAHAHASMPLTSRHAASFAPSVLLVR